MYFLKNKRLDLSPIGRYEGSESALLAVVSPWGPENPRHVGLLGFSLFEGAKGQPDLESSFH